MTHQGLGTHRLPQLGWAPRHTKLIHLKGVWRNGAVELPNPHWPPGPGQPLGHPEQHRVTGGRWDGCQGWLPGAVARAVAMDFCWDGCQGQLLKMLAGIVARGCCQGSCQGRLLWIFAWMVAGMVAMDGCHGLLLGRLPPQFLGRLLWMVARGGCQGSHWDGCQGQLLWVVAGMCQDGLWEWAVTGMVAGMVSRSGCWGSCYGWLLGWSLRWLLWMVAMDVCRSVPGRSLGAGSCWDSS